jgi:hypothetical protein
MWMAIIEKRGADVTKGMDAMRICTYFSLASKVGGCQWGIAVDWRRLASMEGIRQLKDRRQLCIHGSCFLDPILYILWTFRHPG